MQSDSPGDCDVKVSDETIPCGTCRTTTWTSISTGEVVRRDIEIIVSEGYLLKGDSNGDNSGNLQQLQNRGSPGPS